jgi:23S rRNA (cytidine2498-2'-O)-methyltransferase
MESRAFIVRAGQAKVALSELAQVYKQSKFKLINPQVIAGELNAADANSPRSPAFVRQVLPQVQELSADSIKQISQTIFEKLSALQGPWQLHVFAVYGAGSGAGRQRARLVEQTMLAALKKKNRSFLRLLCAPGDFSCLKGASLFQAALLGPQRFLLSCVSAECVWKLRTMLSPFPGGEFEAREDKVAPSRAFKKLIEAELVLGEKICAGQRCVDLGASPGGWSYVALQRSAYVLALDRAELRPDLMNNPKLEFIKGDAFGFKPKETYDWLLSDVVAFPQRVFELLERWFSARACRRFIVTIKFRGQKDYPILERFRPLLLNHCLEWRLKQLNANKNEVTAIGILKV